MFRKIFSAFLIASLFSCAANLSARNQANDNWVGEKSSHFRQLKSSVGKKYMISTANNLATLAGAEMLNRGGNAIDAAIAAQLVLNVVEPQSSGIGGGGFLLYYDAKTKKTTYFNGRETAPEKSDPKMFLSKNGKPRKFEDVVRGGSSVATPGVLKMMKEAHEKYGKLPWNRLFQPAIKVATFGFAVDDRLYANLSSISYISDFDKTAKLYMRGDGKPRQIGEVIKNPEIAQTFKTIAEQGIEPFYKGKIANDIVAEVSNSKINPGKLSLSDLENYKVKKGNLVCGDYRKYKICSMPLPSSGGIALLEILGILENFDLPQMDPSSSKTIHIIAEAVRLGYADRNEYIADLPDVPIEKMLDKNYLKSRAKLIDFEKAPAHFDAGKFVNIANDNYDVAYSYKQPEPLSTTHLSVVDSKGNAVSFTSSIEYFFGSALSVDGFLLNNQMTDFSFEPEINGKKVANRIEPGKRPRSSMTPTFVFDKNGKLLMIVGSPGGPRIIQFVLKTIINYLDFGLDVQEAISAPNYAALSDVLELEKGTYFAKLKNEFEAMGHKVKIVDLTSGIHAITFEKNKIIKGGADPRRAGSAIGN